MDGQSILLRAPEVHWKRKTHARLLICQMFARVFCFLVARIYISREWVGEIQCIIYHPSEIQFSISANTIHTGEKSSGLFPKSYC